MAKAITRPFRRSLAWMLLIVLALGGALGAAATWSNSQLTPLLGLDLEGGTQIILTPVLESGQTVTQEQLDQSVSIIRDRVDAAIAELLGYEAQLLNALPQAEQETLATLLRTLSLDFDGA